MLLFAIVLGMAALVASLSRPVDERRGDSTPRGPAESGPPTATPSPVPEPPAALSFDAAKTESKRLPAGEAATVLVAVDEAGSVEIPGLGLSAPADRFTPARFDVLANRAGRYDLLFTPAAGEEAEPAGRLVVTSAG